MPKLTTLERQLVFAAALLCALASPSPARAQTAAPATVAGRVTDGERGAQGVTVLLVSNEPAQRFRATSRAKTDADGRYLLTNVAPGNYQILPVAPAYVVAELTVGFPPGRRLTVVAGEEVKDIDFRMEPGGVITGRVTDADGNPVVGEQVLIEPAADASGQRPRFDFDQRDQQTDDRGVYRLFGLPAGRYYVSAGCTCETGGVSYGRRKLFRRTYSPDVSERAEARVVEVKPGSEAADIDIKVGRTLKTYKVSGRFVTADTGEPVAGVPIGFGTVDARGRRMGGWGGIAETDARGEFVTDGLAPGHYVVYPTTTFQQQASEFYSDPLSFEVADADVSGLVVKLKRGATVSGVVQIEGVADRAAAAQMLSSLRILPWVENAGQQAAGMGPSRPMPVSPDGTFRLTGIVPGKLRLSAMNEAAKNLSTTRVELNGANVMGGLDVAAGAQVTGVRIVMTYGTATLVGQTTYLNGALAPTARVMAFARPVGAGQGPASSRSAEVDARGFFRFEGLPAGEYEVMVNVFNFGAGRTSRSAPVRVSVGDGGEAKVSPVVDFQAPDPRQPERRKEP